eukprot:jgi/Psemu1/233300/estExt_Genewise1.C_20293
MKIQNIECYDMTVGNIIVDHEQPSSTNVFVTVGIANLDVTCEMDYTYSYGVLSGDGWVQIQTENSDITSTISFTSPDFDQQYPPTDSAVAGCFADVGIERMDFEEDFASEVLEVFQSLVRNTVERAIGDVACMELSVVGTNVVGNMVAMAAEKLEPYLGNLGEAATDPLHLEHKLILPEGLKPLNLQDTEGSVGKTFDEILQYFDTYLGVSVSDSPSGGTGTMSAGDDLVINSLLRSFFLDEDGSRSLPINPTSIPSLTDLVLFEGHDRVTEFTIALNEVRLYGLDTMTRFNSFRKIGKHTIQNELTWDSFTFEFDITIAIKPSTLDDAILIDPTSPGISEDFTIDFKVDNIDVEASLLLVLDEDAMGSMELGPLLYTENLLPCVLSIVHEAKLSGLDVDPSYINDGPTLRGFVSSGLDRVISDSVEAAYAMYKGSLRTAIPNIFQTDVRELLINTFLVDTYFDNESNSVCPKSRSFDEEEFLDFRKLFAANNGNGEYGDLIPMLKNILDDELLAINDETGRPRINEALIAPFTGAQSGTKGTMLFPIDLLSFFTSKTTSQRFEKIQVGALDTNVQFRAYDAKVEKLNTIGAPLELFGGITGEEFLLNNTITAGVGEQPVRFSSKLLLSLQGDDNIEIRNEVDFSLELSNANVIVSTMTKIAESRLLGFPLRDIFDLNCWLATIPAPTLDSRGVRIDSSEVTASLSALKASIGELAVTAKCANCSSPRMAEFTDLLSDPAARNETTDVANALLDYLTELMGGNFLQVQIDRSINDAARKCPHSPTYDPNAEPIVYEAFEAPDSSYSLGNLILLGALALAAMIVLLIIVLAVKCIVRRRHAKWLMKLPPHQIKMLFHHQRSESGLEEKLNTTTRSMFRSTDIPCAVRLMIPIIILSNVALFLSGHLSLGATVNIEAEIAGEKFTIEKFFEFSMARSTIDIWKAGGRELATLIFIFSGIWPYTKLLISLWLWFCSPSIVSISRRGSILTWLDWLAKWSMIDIFVLVISIAAFRISIESPDTSYLPNNFYAIEMMVIPLWGLYANMIAQLLSQVTSHVIIHYHRLIAPVNDLCVGESTAKPTLKAATEEKISLSTHQFSRPHRGETEKLFVRSYVNNILPFCGLSLVIFIAVGCILPSFALELFGLVGVAVEFGQDFEEATVNHSVFSVIKLLFDQASYLGTAKDYIGLIVLSVLFISTILFVPIIQTITLLRQWYFSSTVTEKRENAVRLEILQAWQYLEVYLVALFVSSWQLGSVSNFMINAYCKNLEDTLAQMVYFGVLNERDAQCFSVTSDINNNAFFLVAGAVLLSFLSSFVFKATFQYFRDLENSFEGTNESSSNCLDGASQYDDRTEKDDTGVASNIRPVPVLFTDTFRWLLNSSYALASSSRTLSADSDNGHWSLPEATVVPDSDLPTDSRVPKGTYVSNLRPEGKIDSPTEKKDVGEDGSITSTNSYSSYEYSPKGREVNYDDVDENHSFRYSPRQHRLKSERRDSSPSYEQQSIISQMASMESTSKGEPFETVSPRNSITSTGSTGSSAQSPLSKSRSSSRSSGSFRKAPPSEYRLSRTPEKSPQSRTSAVENGSMERNPRNLKQPPPSQVSTTDQSNKNKTSPSSCLSSFRFASINDRGAHVTIQTPEKSPQSRASAVEKDFMERNPRNPKQPPPSPFSTTSCLSPLRFASTDDRDAHITIQNEYGKAALFTDEGNGDERRTSKSINDIIKEVGDDEDANFLHFEDVSLSQQSTSHRDSWSL